MDCYSFAWALPFAAWYKQPFFLVASYARSLLTIIITISQGHLSYKMMMILRVQSTVVVFSNTDVLDYVSCAEVGK